MDDDEELELDFVSILLLDEPDPVDWLLELDGSIWVLLELELWLELELDDWDDEELDEDGRIWVLLELDSLLLECPIVLELLLELD